MHKKAKFSVLIKRVYPVFAFRFQLFLHFLQFLFKTQRDSMFKEKGCIGLRGETGTLIKISLAFINVNLIELSTVISKHEIWQCNNLITLH